MSVKKVNNALELIGNTPLIKLNRVVPDGAANVYVKAEFFNVGGSIKDRTALNMLEHAEAEGLIKPGDTLIEATSGNTGIGLAMIAAIKGYKLVIVMGTNASVERRRLLQAYGAELVLVEPTAVSDNMNANLRKMEELVNEYGYYPLRQCENPHNPEVHELTTGPEILEAFDGIAPDAFVAGIGTGGTITGTGHFLKQHNPNIHIVAVEPSGSPVLSGGNPGTHAIQGIGAGFVPKILDTTVYDEIIAVTDDEAISMVRKVASQEGLILGYSGGAAIHAAVQTAIKLGEGKNLVVIAPDTGERYLSTPAYQF